MASDNSITIHNPHVHTTTQEALEMYGKLEGPYQTAIVPNV